MREKNKPVPNGKVSVGEFSSVSPPCDQAKQGENRKRPSRPRRVMPPEKGKRSFTMAGVSVAMLLLTVIALVRFAAANGSVPVIFPYDPDPETEAAVGTESGIGVEGETESSTHAGIQPDTDTSEPHAGNETTGEETGHGAETEADSESQTGSEVITDWRDHGINLFDTSFETGGLNNQGAEITDDRRIRSGFITVSPATVYTLSVEHRGAPFYTSYIYEYDSEFRYLHYAGVSQTTAPFTFATTSDTAYIRVQSGSGENATAENAAVAGYWLERGTVSTPWEYFILPLYTKDEPENEGVRNALDRLSVFSTSVLETRGNGFAIGYANPARQGTQKPYDTLHLASGSLMYAFPYSSVRKTDTYVGYEVSLDTFFTALYNPASILYTSDYSNPSDPGYSPFIQYVWTPYGSVCSTIVGYALDIGIRYTTYELSDVPGMTQVNPLTEGLALCDIMCNVTSADKSGGHMAIVSNILRREDGSIASVELTDASIPCIQRTYISYEYFINNYLKMYSVYRYDKLSLVPPCDSAILNGTADYNTVLGIDRGDVSVYREGDEVHINLFTEESGTLIIRHSETAGGDGTALESIPADCAVMTNVNGIPCRIVTYLPEVCGYYSVSFVTTDGTESDAIRFCVASPGTIRFENGETSLTVRENEEFSVLFGSGEAAEPFYICIETQQYVTRNQRYLEQTEIADGKATLSCTELGEMYVLIYYRNEYGRITSERLRLMVK